ncbi:MAG: Uncharacterized protein G01um10147_929 [Microgenomates group bacterium Gr01-1014_7]|nr:MAG: Uncharacterized protein G01um10147_929 [Microgenomates group bacterium Gr01-1014_7]
MIIKTLKDLAKSSQYDQQLMNIMGAFVPLALQLPQLRDNPQMMEEIIKKTSVSGVTDVATNADIFVQGKLKSTVLEKHPDWQFWGEEGKDNISEYDSTKKFLFIIDPIEGTNNFKSRKDNQWGSVVALVDIETKIPVLGIVALPSRRRFYLGIKNAGAYTVEYGEDGQVKSFSPMPEESEFSEFTYNNSPHFEEPLTQQVQRFFALGTIQPDEPSADDLERSRKVIQIGGVTFVDPESGALEAIRNRGTIYFKTSNEMAAVFVILNELGGKVTDGNGNSWVLGINTLIAAKNETDYNFLKNLCDKTK